ncbi:MAG: T9SS type A sorting domain-containing protein [Lewinellaceae bacterium]|nr:T9SS type A sorting domain-containing protein [Saprospiraceae bacterium]MCB9338399.1 T9SS type A sorting domain-containing protein [Lewinellaceae bacterium]
MKKKLFTHFALYLPMCLMLIVANTTTATTYTFQSSGSWSTASKWSTGTVPPLTLPAGDEIIINANCTYTMTAHQFLNGSLTVKSSKTLTLTKSSGAASSLILNITGTVDIEPDGTLNTSGNRAHISNNDGIITNNGTIGSYNNFNQKKTLNNYGTITIGGIFQFYSSTSTHNYGIINHNTSNSTGGVGSFINYAGANLNINSGTFKLTSNYTATNEGTITIGISGTLLINNGRTLTNTNTGTIINNNNFNLDNNGNFINDGIFTNNDIVNITNNSTIKGSGTFNGDLTIPSNGTLSPGSSPGCLTFNGGLTNNGNLQIELDDGSACTNFDQITVTGDATVNGSIEVSFVGGTAPSTTTFTILTATGALTGSPTITWPTGYSGTFSIINASNPKEFQLSFSLLPIELTAFRASLQIDNSVLLHWLTASELNNAGFHLQRSPDGKNWQDLTFVPGHGTTQAEQSYTYTDERPLSGLNYYRLQQEDFDGASEFSKVISVEMRGAGSGIRLFPNPATGNVTLALESDYAGEATLTLYDLLGKQMKTQVLSLEGNAFRTSIGLDGLPAGVYLAEVMVGLEQWQQRLVVE